MTLGSLSVDDKRQALERVLGSRTFARSEQLRAFLRYVCEAEFEGRAQQLNEYALGVAVLGRPESYSPAEDSCVRSRAYELRNKLASYYRAEAPRDPIGIEIDKGAYVPRFVTRVDKDEVTPKTIPPHAVPTSIPVPAAAEAPAPALALREDWRSRPTLAALAIALVCASLAVYFFRASREHGSTREPRPLSREMAALWGPFEASSAPMLVSFEIRPFFYAPATGLVVRDYQVNSPGEAASSEPLRRFQERMGASELRETLDYADFGAVHAAFLIGHLLNRDVALKHSSALGWEDIANNNIVFIGKPNLNPTIRDALRGKDFVEEYGVAIRNLHPHPGELDVYGMAETHGEGEKHALITVMPGPQPGRRMMILSGAGAELMWALAEAVTNPERVKEIMAHVLPASGDPPPAFQIVISATFKSNVPVKIRYVTHRITAAG